MIGTLVERFIREALISTLDGNPERVAIDPRLKSAVNGESARITSVGTIPLRYQHCAFFVVQQVKSRDLSPGFRDSRAQHREIKTGEPFDRVLVVRGRVILELQPKLISGIDDDQLYLESFSAAMELSQRESQISRFHWSYPLKVLEPYRKGLAPAFGLVLITAAS